MSTGPNRPPASETPRTRRTPLQARSREAVEAIVVATASIVEEMGPKALTTARIADRAGLGVGTVYDYFPTKTAILLAMAGRMVEAVRSDIEARLAPPWRPGDPKADAALVEAVIDDLIERFSGPARLPALLLQTLCAEGRAADLAEALAWVARALSGPGGGPDAAPEAGDTDSRATITARAIVGAIHTWALESPRGIGAEPLRLGLTRLAVLSWVRARPDGAESVTRALPTPAEESPGIHLPDESVYAISTSAGPVSEPADSTPESTPNGSSAMAPDPGSPSDPQNPRVRRIFQLARFGRELLSNARRLAAQVWRRRDR